MGVSGCISWCYSPGLVFLVGTLLAETLDREKEMSENPDSPVSPLPVDHQWQRKGNTRIFATDSNESLTDVGLKLPHEKAQLASTHIEHVSLLDTFSNPNVVRNTGIICTIGNNFCFGLTARRRISIASSSSCCCCCFIVRYKS